jgi:LmbE family N-acetylglucosaminyl deacetylase
MKHAVFISPHLDDAVFSCGALMLALQKQGISCTVLTVFTQADESSQTLSARSFLRQIGYSSAEQLYAKRRAEDMEVLKSMGVKCIHLGEVDALWRKKSKTSGIQKILAAILPEFSHVYPVYKFHILSGKIRIGDTLLISHLAKLLQTHVDRDTVVFCPLSIGGHVDHMVVTRACEDMSHPLVYWADIPYVARPGHKVSPVKTDALIQKKMNDTQLLIKKARLCARYKTQYVPVFGDTGAAKIPETYYYDEKWQKALKTLSFSV